MVLRDTSVKTKLYSNGLCLRKFSRMQSGRPETDVQHFFEKPAEETLVGVVVPIYNEQAGDLRKTLLAMDMQVNYMKAQKKPIAPHIMLVQDGVGKASDSMKKYLRNMFNLDEEQWKREFEVEDNSAPYQTFILQKLNGSFVTTVNINAGYKTNTPDNRKKHNSHEWFLGESGFIAYYRPKYSFCTDCSTLFHKACLMKLITYMEANPTCGVCTGRQRVMTATMQGDPDESMFSLASLLRHSQRFDYESSFVCYTGTFSAVGFLPVVPGPCGLYRSDILLPDKDVGGYENSPSEWYFDVVNTDPDKSGMILGNLRIAEDRVLSYAVVLKAKTPSYMGLVPQAVFYFEAETKLKTLMLQRRRWINGTWAGYWYLAIQHPDLIFNCTQLNVFSKLFVWFLLLCQLVTYIIVALAPAIFLGALRLSLQNLAVDTDGVLAIAVWLLLVLLYLYFVYHHHTNVYLGYLFNIWLLFSAVLSITSITSFIVYVAKNGYLIHPSNLAIGDFSNDTFTASLTIYIVISMLLLPLFIAIIADGSKSVLLMLRSIVPYYMLLPMVVGFFSAYSFARCWDLTWGNRPSEADPSHEIKAKQKIEDLRTNSATLAAFICIANCFFFFLQELILEHNSGKLYIAFVIFSTAIIQMTIGLIWFTLWRIGYFFQRSWFLMSHCRGSEKYTYNKPGDELDDADDNSSDIYTLYYGDEERSDINEDDFINDSEPAEDYYDFDADALVLVDGNLQRHMSVTNLQISYGPNGELHRSDGISAPMSPAIRSPKTPLTPSLLKGSNPLVVSRSALRSSNTLVRRNTQNTLPRRERTAMANANISPNRMPIVSSPARRPPLLKSSMEERRPPSLHCSSDETFSDGSHPPITRTRSTCLPQMARSPLPDARNRLSYSHQSSTSSVSFADQVEVISNNNNNHLHLHPHPHPHPLPHPPNHPVPPPPASDDSASSSSSSSPSGAGAN